MSTLVMRIAFRWLLNAIVFLIKMLVECKYNEMEDKAERNRSRMGRRHFYRHLDASESGLEIIVLEQSTVEKRCYSYVTHTLRTLINATLITSTTCLKGCN